MRTHSISTTPSTLPLDEHLEVLEDLGAPEVPEDQEALATPSEDQTTQYPPLISFPYNP